MGWLDSGDMVASVVAGAIALGGAVLAFVSWRIRRREEKADAEYLGMVGAIRKARSYPERRRKYEHNQRRLYVKAIFIRDETPDCEESPPPWPSLAILGVFALLCLFAFACLFSFFRSNLS
jgi:hypothetical protein